MPRKPLAFEYGYKDIQELTGLTDGTLRQHHIRGYMDVTDLKSVILFIVRHATLDFRLELVREALDHERMKGFSKSPKRMAKKKAAEKDKDKG